MLHASSLMLALSLAPATATSVLTYYDAAGKHPQCSQGPETYMKQCVLTTDYFAYMLSADPITTTTQNCTELGYEYVAADPIFSKFDIYWKGGPAGFQAWGKSFNPGHPGTIKFLSAARDKQPGCKDHHRTPLTPLTQPPHTTDATMTAYDESGVLPQCAEGPAAYMANCTFPNDMVAYMLSGKPVLVPGSKCTSMGYEKVTTDNIYPLVTLYWKKGHKPSMSEFFTGFFKNHTSAFQMLNFTRDHTPACKIDS